MGVMTKQTRELILRHILTEARQLGLRKVRIRYVAISIFIADCTLLLLPHKQDALIAVIEFASNDYLRF